MAKTPARIFQPEILQTKEELRIALRNGEIKSSKFHMLDEAEQMFVEMIVFGNYKPAQAMKVLRPELSNYAAAARRMSARQHIAEVIEELTYKRDTLWLTRITSARETALGVMDYVMKTTDDPALKVATAKEIIKAADAAIKNNKRPEEQVQGITFNIEFAPNTSNPNRGYNPDDVVIIEGEAPDPASGMPYTLGYAEQIKKNYGQEGEFVEIDEEESNETSNTEVSDGDTT